MNQRTARQISALQIRFDEERLGYRTIRGSGNILEDVRAIANAWVEPTGPGPASNGYVTPLPVDAKGNVLPMDDEPAYFEEWRKYQNILETAPDGFECQRCGDVEPPGSLFATLGDTVTICTSCLVVERVTLYNQGTSNEGVGL